MVGMLNSATIWQPAEIALTGDIAEPVQINTTATRYWKVWIQSRILSVLLDESFWIDHIEDRNDNSKPRIPDQMFAGVVTLSYFLTRLFVIACVLVAVICMLVWIRRPLARNALRREMPATATVQEIEAKVKSSQRKFGLKVWFFVFCLPMLIIIALMAANNMAVRLH